MRRVAYMVVVLFLLVLLCWPRPVAPPALVDSAEAPSTSATAEDATEDHATDTAVETPPLEAPTGWEELLRETRPSTLPPPSDQGLLQDLEQAVGEIHRTGEAARDDIGIRPEFTPLLPAPNPEVEPEPEPDPDP